MKKKKFFSYMLLGLLAVGATGTVTSCKDYDDDINGLQTQVNDLNTQLQSCKSNCETNLASLKSQLEAQTATVNQLTTQYNQLASDVSKKAEQTALQAEIDRATAAEAGLTSKINTLQSALDDVNALLAKKVDQETYNAKMDEIDGKISEIYAKLESVDENLGTALTRIGNLESSLTSLNQTVENVKADLQQQVDALNEYKEAMETRLGEVAADYTSKISALKDDLQGQIDKLASAQSVADLKAVVDGNVAKIDKLQAQVNVLNVLVEKALRGLVFIPDAYYYGVEATKVQALDYWKFSVPATGWDKKEAKGYNDHARYDSAQASRMLTFVANYHMNPSSADLKDFGKLSILTDDKEFIGRAAASAPFVVKDYKKNNEGNLEVSIDVAKPELIKNIPDNQAITVFALQVNTNKSGQDTTVTSDYATIYKESIKNLKLYHAAGTGVPFTGVKNTHDPSPALTGSDANHVHNNVLMQTAHEASYDYPEAQDTVFWNGTLDLSKLVEVHYTTVEGENKVLTAAQMEANGLSYKFELTGLYYGDNETSESAHAAIQGTTLRPQMPEYDAEHIGKQQAYGANQDRQEIGRTPLVRVELVDADNNVLDYGYIRIRIAEENKVTPTDKDQYVEYTGDGWTYTDNGECQVTANPWSYKTKWIQTEYDLYNKLQLTRDEFESIYKAEATNNGDLVQYELKSNGKFEKAANTYGVVYEHPDVTGQTSAQTQVLEWSITGADMKKFFVDQKKKQLDVAIRYASNNRNYRDIYVLFHTGTPITINGTMPTADAEIIGNQIPNFWFATNSANAGTDEIHTQTLSPEDNLATTAEALDNRFSDVFTGNQIVATKFVKNIKDYTASKEYAAGNLTLDLVFDDSNNGKEYGGYLDGAKKTYVMSVGDNGKTLYANIKGQTQKQPVAVIEGNDINQQKVVYVHNTNKNGYSESLLNYVAHNELADDVITAIIGLKAQNRCSKNLPLANNTFNVRFLRPLNVFDNEAEVEDAANKPQTINISDLVSFTDWRDLWNGAAKAGNGGKYYTYYGVDSIYVANVSNGKNIATNPMVRTNLGESDPKSFVPLNTKSNQIDFTINNGVITYRNLSSAVRDFDVIIPVAVKYIWGTVYKDVTIHVKKTLNNAKKR